MCGLVTLKTGMKKEVQNIIKMKGAAMNNT